MSDRDWYQLHVVIEALPEQAAPGPVLDLDIPERLPTLLMPDASLRDGLPVTFEEAAIHLEQLERMFFEPDGSFVWVGQDAGERWQVDGQLYDRAGKLLTMELKGRAPTPAVEQLLAAVGWPSAALVYQLPRYGVYLDETAWRRWATTAR